MKKIKQSKLEKSTLRNRFRNLASGALGFGVILTSAHIGLLAVDHSNIAPAEFKAKVAGELHTHSDIKLSTNRVMVDPKYLRSVRSEGDKLSDFDHKRGSWDAYLA